MNKFKIQKAVVCCLLSVGFIACSKTDHDSYCPTWKGFTYTVGNRPNDVAGKPGKFVELHPGDSIHLTAHQDKRGHLINATYYTWTICYDTLDTNGERSHANKTIPQHTNYDGYAAGYDDKKGDPQGPADPVCHLLLPENALPTEANKPDTIRFVARYTYSGQGVIVENGNIVDNTSFSGVITPQSGPTGGGAAGNFFFIVVKR